VNDEAGFALIDADDRQTADSKDLVQTKSRDPLHRMGGRLDDGPVEVSQFLVPEGPLEFPARDLIEFLPAPRVEAVPDSQGRQPEGLHVDSLDCASFPAGRRGFLGFCEKAVLVHVNVPVIALRKAGENLFDAFLDFRPFRLRDDAGLAVGGAKVFVKRDNVPERWIRRGIRGGEAVLGDFRRHHSACDPAAPCSQDRAGDIEPSRA